MSEMVGLAEIAKCLKVDGGIQHSLDQIEDVRETELIRNFVKLARQRYLDFTRTN